MMVRCVLVLALCLLSMLQLNAASVVQQARSQRDAVAAQLAADRLQRQEHRAALQQRLRAMEDSLQQAQARAQRLEQRHRELRLHTEQMASEHAALAQQLAANERQWRAQLALPVDAPMAEVEAQFAATLRTIERLFVVTVAEASIFNRAGKPVQTTVVNLGGNQRIAVGINAAERGFIRSDTAASQGRVTGPLLPNFDPQTHLALDVGGVLARDQQQRPSGLIAWFQAGGATMWVLLAVAVVAALVVIDRTIMVGRSRPPRGLAAAVLAQPQQTHAELMQPSSPLARVLARGLAHPMPEREAYFEAALLRESTQLERGMAILAACGAAAPLLGLLGTVSGMIGTFDSIAVHGTGDAQLMAGGIGVALVTTQAGLMIAVPILLAHAILSRRIERRLIECESVAVELCRANDA